jgi:hypothetical protein
MTVVGDAKTLAKYFHTPLLFVARQTHENLKSTLAVAPQTLGETVFFMMFPP